VLAETMKFTHGIWFNKEDTTIHNAVEVYRVTYPKPGEIQALCTTRHIASRGDTLNKPTITLSLSSPLPNIVRGEAWHFRGAPQNEPRFELTPDLEEPSIHQAAIDSSKSECLSLKTDGLVAELNTTSRAFSVRYKSAEGQSLTGLGFESLQYVVAPPATSTLATMNATTDTADPYYRASSSRTKQPFMVLAFDLQPGEYVYGLGERFGPMTRNGQEIDIWNEDAGTCTLYAYKNIPFYITNKGYGIFFDHSDVLSLEIQSEKLAKVQVSLQGERIRWHVIHGSTPKQILSRYADLTGHPALPPAWTFGLYLSSSFLTEYDEKTVTTQLDGMSQRDIPVSVFHFDCFWMAAHSWTSFTFDPVYFPKPSAFLQSLHARNLKICVWINSYIAQDTSTFTEAAQHGYLLKRRDGSIWQSDNWQAGMGIVDFTNPAAVSWYQSKLSTLLSLGVDTFKTDFGERIPHEDVLYHDTTLSPRAMHNYYAHLYNKAVHDLLVRERGPHEAALFARAATAGGQRFPVHWGGDCECTWNGMAQSLRGGLSLGLSGFGFWSHDIGGFMSEGQAKSVPDANLYKRWVQFGLLSSHSRLHGSQTYRVPWLVDEEASAVLRKFARLKNALMPYLYAKAIEAHREGTPVLRAMVLEFPDDRTCHTLDQQYMLGDGLLVAPIFNDEGVVEYYVPQGKWVGLLDGKVRQGPGWVTETYDNMHLPVLVREDHVILLGDEDRPDYDWAASIRKIVVGAPSGKVKEVKVPIPDASKPGQYAQACKVSLESDPKAAIGKEDVSAKIVVLDESNHY
jgi:alpha-D-xyloside xylohydrolase